MRKKEAREIKPVYHPQWKLSRVISGHMGWVRAITVDPANQWFATGAGDRVIKVRRISMSELTLDLGSCVWRAQTIADGTYLYHSRIGCLGSTPISLFLCRGQGELGQVDYADNRW